MVLLQFGLIFLHKSILFALEQKKLDVWLHKKLDPGGAFSTKIRSCLLQPNTEPYCKRVTGGPQYGLTLLGVP